MPNPDDFNLRRTLDRLGYVSVTIHLSIGEVAVLHATLQSSINSIHSQIRQALNRSGTTCTISGEMADLDEWLRHTSLRLSTHALCGSAHKARMDNGFAIADEETFLVFRLKTSAVNAWFLVEALLRTLRWREQSIIDSDWLPDYWAEDLIDIYGCAQATAAKIMSSCGFIEMDCLRDEWESLREAGLNTQKLDRWLELEAPRGR